MQKELYHIPGKVIGHHHPEINSIIDTWDSLLISLDDWRSTIYEVGIVDYAPRNGVKAWIIDTSKSQGVFKPEVQEFREKVARPKLAENGVRHLFVVLPATALGKLSAKKTARLYGGQKSMKSHYVTSIQEAVNILKAEGEI